MIVENKNKTTISSIITTQNHPYSEQFSFEMDMPFFHGLPRSYLLASTPRCGSHFLGHALIERGCFGVPLEYFNGNNMRYWHQRFGTRDLEGLVSKLIKYRTSPSGWFGVKSHWPQFARHIKGRGITPIGQFSRAIFLYRRDLLGQAISFLRALQTKQWISASPKRGNECYNYEEIISCGKKIEITK